MKVFAHLFSQLNKNTMTFYSKKFTSAEQKRVKKQIRGSKNRKRSKNEWIDKFLQEEKGGDDFADLEDWIVADDGK